MNWEAIGAVGELLGASVVLVTLIYLAVQIKQNTAAVATATYESTMTGFNDINVVVASNPALSALIDRGCQNVDSLNAEEVVQFNFLLRCYANQWWNYSNCTREVACQGGSGASLLEKQPSFWISRVVSRSAPRMLCLRISTLNWIRTKVK